MSLRPYLPNRSWGMALVSLGDERPFRSYWPLHLTQIIGGKTWSLSLVRFQTEEPVIEDTRADIWGDGYEAGHADARAVNENYPDRTTNPYRSAT